MASDLRCNPSSELFTAKKRQGPALSPSFCVFRTWRTSPLEQAVGVSYFNACQNVVLRWFLDQARLENDVVCGDSADAEFFKYSFPVEDGKKVVWGLVAEHGAGVTVDVG